MNGKQLRINSTIAIIDVTRGRKALAKRIAAGEVFFIDLKGVVNNQNSRHDGVSIEFGVDVTSIKLLSAASGLAVSVETRHESDRAFPDATDGRPRSDMEVALWAAGADCDTSNLVSRMLAQEGYRLVDSDGFVLQAPGERR